MKGGEHEESGDRQPARCALEGGAADRARMCSSRRSATPRSKTAAPAQRPSLSLENDLPLVRADAASSSARAPNARERRDANRAGHPVSVRGGHRRSLLVPASIAGGDPPARARSRVEPFYRRGSATRDTSAGGWRLRGSWRPRRPRLGGVAARQGKSFVVESLRLLAPASRRRSVGPRRPRTATTSSRSCARLRSSRMPASREPASTAPRRSTRRPPPPHAAIIASGPTATIESALAGSDRDPDIVSPRSRGGPEGARARGRRRRLVTKPFGSRELARPAGGAANARRRRRAGAARRRARDRVAATACTGRRGGPPHRSSSSC